MSRIEKFVTMFKVPEFVVPYLSCFVSEAEMDLVVLLDGQKYSVSEVAKRMGCSLEQAKVLLEGCYFKNILHREVLDKEFVYFGSDFYERLDFVCKFDDSYKGKIDGLEDEDQDTYDAYSFLKALDEWCYQVYAERMDPYLEKLKNKEAVDRAPEAFLMMGELEELLDSVTDIRLVPCNCRKLAERCAKPTETCLSFDASITDRTFGRSISKDTAREIVKKSHQKGLMHQINSDWREKGPAWMCNCCACCCYPIRVAQEKETKGVFPVIQHVARRDEGKCSHCGICVKQCNFSAFYQGEAEAVVKGKPRKRIEFEQDKCWGCGICVNGCVSRAISMVPLR